MNSRERVRMAVNHKTPDRIPIDLGSMRSSGIASIAYNNLLKKLGIKTIFPTRMYDFIQQLAYPDKSIMELFHIDTIDAGQAFLQDINEWKEWELDDGSKCIIPKFLNIEFGEDGTVYLLSDENEKLGKKPRTSLYVDQCFWVYKDLPCIPDNFKDKDLSRHVWAIPSPPWHLDIFNNDIYLKFINTIKDLYESTDYSIVLSVGCNMFETGTFLRGMENFMMDMYSDKLKTKKLLDKLVEINIIKLERIISGVGKYIDFLQFGDDLGGQSGAFMSQEIYQEVFKPRHKKMWDFVHKNSNCKVFLHSCGSIYELLPDLIDAGLDVINPVQTTTRNMEPEKLKREFGKDIVFWGGCCNTRDILAKGTPEEIKNDVKKRISILGENGGLVFNQIHNILADVPPENIIAMLEAAYEYGKY
ncbi:MAG TPA: methyltransferase [Actinobacteria bacterium]|jgi:uroporphyrinogen decarboxylase|nr:methyltransferase [Actinomycetota bacterium]